METYVVEVSETLISGDGLNSHYVEYAGPDKETALERARNCFKKIKRRDNCSYFFITTTP